MPTLCFFMLLCITLCIPKMALLFYFFPISAVAVLVSIINALVSCNHIAAPPILTHICMLLPFHASFNQSSSYYFARGGAFFLVSLSIPSSHQLSAFHTRAQKRQCSISRRSDCRTYRFGHFSPGAKLFPPFPFHNLSLVTIVLIVATSSDVVPTESFCRDACLYQRFAALSRQLPPALA